MIAEDMQFFLGIISLSLLLLVLQEEALFRQFFILLINILTAPFGSCIDNIEFHSVKLTLFNSFFIVNKTV